MKNKPFCLVLALLICSTFSALARQTTIELVTTFSYPGAGTNTQVWAINDRGEVAGGVRIGTNSRGFVRYADGTFSPSLIEPNDTTHQTVAHGLNNGRTLSGSYVDADGYHGFFYHQGTFTEFDIASATATLVNQLNDGGDFVGGFFADGTSVEQGFVSGGGNVTTFGVPGSIGTEATGINNLGEVVGFFYPSGAAFPSGFFRDSVGNIIAPLVPPGADNCYLFGINDRGRMVGNYFDSQSLIHGVFVRLPNIFVRFDVPGATETWLTGINEQGTMCGFYRTGTGFYSGFIAQLTETDQ